MCSLNLRLLVCAALPWAAINLGCGSHNATASNAGGAPTVELPHLAGRSTEPASSTAAEDSRAQTAEPNNNELRTAEPLLVSIDIHSRIELDGKVVADDPDFMREGARARLSHTSHVATIRSFAQVPYRQIIHVMDLLRQVGFEEISFEAVQ